MRFILASGSPRRKELLKLIVQDFEVIISGVNETLEEGLTPSEQVTRLAYIKAKDVFNKTDGDRIVIGSDTIVTREGKIYGKPHDKNHAKQMLNELFEGNKIHNVMTGLAVLISMDGEYKEFKICDEAEIVLKDVSEKEIDRWIATGKADDKAGAYGIQDEFCVFIENIKGNYNTIMGLPTHKLYDIIKEYIIDY